MSDRGAGAAGHRAGTPEERGGEPVSASDPTDAPDPTDASDPTDAPAGWTELEESELERWGRRLGAAAARGGVFVALDGPLGAGKTRLVQAACRGAGVVEDALSPTFTLVHRYEGERGPVWHVDLYRIERPSELDDLGWEELGSGGAPTFVEWAERASGRLPSDRWEVRLEMGSRPETRRVRAIARGGAPVPPPPEPEAGWGRGG